MYLIGATRNLADAPHGRVKHHYVAFGDAERPEVARQFSSRPHRCLLFALCSLLFALCSLLFALCSLLSALCSLLCELSLVERDERDRSLFGEAAREDVGAREAIEIARNRKAEVIKNRRSDVDDRRALKIALGDLPPVCHHETIGRALVTAAQFRISHDAL